jgi:hypothetical protein
MIYVFYVVMAQNIEEERLRRIIDDVLDDSSDSESDIFVNSDSDNDNTYCASANKESTGKHHLFYKPNFPRHCLLTCVNNGSKLFYFHYFRLRFRIIQ